MNKNSLNINIQEISILDDFLPLWCRLFDSHLSKYLHVRLLKESVESIARTSPGISLGMRPTNKRVLQCNDVSHWLGSYLAWSLHHLISIWIIHYKDVIWILWHLKSPATFFNSLFKLTSQKKSQTLHHWLFLPQGTGNFPSQMITYAEIISISRLHHVLEVQLVDAQRRAINKRIANGFAHDHCIHIYVKDVNVILQSPNSETN